MITLTFSLKNKTKGRWLSVYLWHSGILQWCATQVCNITWVIFFLGMHLNSGHHKGSSVWVKLLSEREIIDKLIP